MNGLLWVSDGFEFRLLDEHGDQVGRVRPPVPGNLEAMAHDGEVLRVARGSDSLYGLEGAGVARFLYDLPAGPSDLTFDGQWLWAAFGTRTCRLLAPHVTTDGVGWIPYGGTGSTRPRSSARRTPRSRGRSGLMTAAPSAW